jgi:hypothetical protein
MLKISTNGHGEIRRVVDLAFEGQQGFAKHNIDLVGIVDSYASRVSGLVSGVLADQGLSITPIGSAVRGTALPGRTDLDFYLFSGQLNDYDNNGLKHVSRSLQECYWHNLGGTIHSLRSTDVALAHRVSRLHADSGIAVDGLSYLEVFLGKSEPKSSALVTAHTQLQAMQTSTSGSTERALRLKYIFDQLGIYGTNTNLVGRGLNGVATELLALRADLIGPNQVVELVVELVDLILHIATDDKNKIADGVLKLPLTALVPDFLSSMPVELKEILKVYTVAADHATVLSCRLCSS